MPFKKINYNRFDKKCFTKSRFMNRLPKFIYQHDDNEPVDIYKRLFIMIRFNENSNMNLVDEIKNIENSYIYKIDFKLLDKIQRDEIRKILEIENMIITNYEISDAKIKFDQNNVVVRVYEKYFYIFQGEFSKYEIKDNFVTFQVNINVFFDSCSNFHSDFNEIFGEKHLIISEKEVSKYQSNQEFLKKIHFKQLFHFEITDFINNTFGKNDMINILDQIFHSFLNPLSVSDTNNKEYICFSFDGIMDKRFIGKIIKLVDSACISKEINSALVYLARSHEDTYIIKKKNKELKSSLIILRPDCSSTLESFNFCI